MKPGKMDNKQPSASWSDEALMEVFKGGDIAGFDFLVEKYQTQIVNYLYRLTGNFKFAEDISQETFLTVYRKAKLFRPTGRFKPWFYKIATNLCNYELRKRSRFSLQKMAAHDLNEAKHFLGTKPINPAQEAEEKDLQSQIQKLINSLPQKQKTALTLHIFEGFTYKEIARIVGCNIGTVRSRIHYGLKRVRDGIVGSESTT